MNKAAIIQWRDTIKCGKNIPLRIIFDNNYTVDENTPLTYVKWDDASGIIYIFRLSNLTDTTTPSNRDQTISVFSAPYELIWYLEIAKLPLEMLDDVFNAIGTLSPQFKENIKYAFTEAIHPDRWRLDHSDINATAGFDVMDTKDEYYRGKFAEPFKETREHARHNEFIKNKNKQDNP